MPYPDYYFKNMEKPSTARIALKWGLIFSIVSVIATTAFNMTDLWTQSMLLFLFGTASSILMLYLAMAEFRKLNGGYMSIGEGLGIGMLTTATSAVVSMLYDTAYQRFIDPTLLERKMEIAEEQYKKVGMTDEQIAESIEQMERLNNSGVVMMIGIVVALIIGFVLSLIVAAVLKKDKPVFD